MSSETHINAYYAEVEEAKLEVHKAEQKLHKAERRLREREVELGLAKEPTESEKPEEVEQTEAWAKALPEEAEQEENEANSGTQIPVRTKPSRKKTGEEQKQ